MGMLFKGNWKADDTVIEHGAYKRPPCTIQRAQAPSSQRALMAPGRIWLIVSFSCPWSHRTTLTRQLKGLHDRIHIHYAFGQRSQGYSLNDGNEWIVPGTSTGYLHLHEMYRLHDENFTGRATVPVLWDSKTRSILSNESSDIMQALDALHSANPLDFTLKPPALSGQIETANRMIYRGLNNAVYRAGFAQTQSAYEQAVKMVFETLDHLELHLQSNRFYFGNVLTETDLRLFPTLIRFDSIYYILFKCCRRRICDYPALAAYTRDILQLTGVEETIDFHAMRQQSYLNDSSSPHPIIAIQPDTNWDAQHARSELGAIQVGMPSRQLKSMAVEVEILPIVGILVVATITPGPNNIIVFQAAVTGGIRSATPLIAGIVTGSLFLLLCSALGIGFLLNSNSLFVIVMSTLGSVYLIWLGLKLLRATVSTDQDDKKHSTLPSSFLAVAVFQFANPKSWILMSVVSTKALPHMFWLNLVALLIFIFVSCLLLWVYTGVYLNTQIQKTFPPDVV